MLFSISRISDFRYPSLGRVLKSAASAHHLECKTGRFFLQQGTEIRRSSKSAPVTAKGKIPHSEWAKIAARREAGESFAEIARDYSCSPPAIRYIVNRTKRRDGSPGNSLRQRKIGRGFIPLVPSASGAATGGSERPLQIDAALRQRVGSAIASFLAAFDASLGGRSASALDELLEATDSLMRAAARTRIELERLRNFAGEQKEC
jgi:hypothetical protein